MFEEPSVEHGASFRGNFGYNSSMAKDDPVIKPTTGLFIAPLLSAPKNEPILSSLLSGVMTGRGTFSTEQFRL